MKQAALLKMQKYCAYQERCHQEVIRKLYELKIYGDDQDEILASLVTDGYLNEERFARSYARGKFRINQWGRVKIKQGLKQKQVSDYCIEAGMQEISEEEYLDAIRDQAERLSARYGDMEDPAVRHKTWEALVRKGYESWLVSQVLGEE